jgi:hypothetical protein
MIDARRPGAVLGRRATWFTPGSPLVSAPRMSGVNALARLGLKQVVGLAAVDVEAGSGD